MTRVIKPRTIEVCGEKRVYEVVPTPWYDRVILSLMGVSFSALDLGRGLVAGLVLVAVVAALCAFLVTAYFASH